MKPTKETTKNKIAKKENPHEGHRKRMRERYNATGFNGFQDHEVLEMLLYYCYPNGDTNETAHRMLNEFHTIHHLFESDVDVLMKKLNCSERIAVFLNMMPKITKVYLESKWKYQSPVLTRKQALAYVRPLFIGLKEEYFFVMTLNTAHKVINITCISKGSVNEVAPHFSHILDEVVMNKASSIILVHNHPAGTITPSISDIKATRAIVEKLNAIKIDVIDHLIIADNKYYSFAEHDKYVKGY